MKYQSNSQYKNPMDYSSRDYSKAGVVRDGLLTAVYLRTAIVNSEWNSIGD
jgi:hypothetical protein